jgi:hypothetical protein
MSEVEQIGFLRLVINIDIWIMDLTNFSTFFLIRGVHPCDKRKSVSECQFLFPAVDFSLASAYTKCLNACGLFFFIEDSL